MNYFKLTFANGELFYVSADQDLAGVIKYIQRYTSICFFDTTVMLERPTKVEALKAKPAATVYEFEKIHGAT